MPQLDGSTYLAQLFWLGVCFFFLWGVMHFLVVPRFRRFFEERSGRLEALLQEAEEIEQKAEHIIRVSEENFEQAQKEGRRALHRDIENMERSFSQLKKDAEDAQRLALKALSREAEKMRNDVLKELDSLVPQLALSAREKIDLLDALSPGKDEGG